MLLLLAPVWHHALRSIPGLLLCGTGRLSNYNNSTTCLVVLLHPNLPDSLNYSLTVVNIVVLIVKIHIMGVNGLAGTL